MKYDSIDKALRGLFNIAFKSPQSVKQIFFSDGGLIDARSIRHTIDYDNSRIPTEEITLARNTLSICYRNIDEQMPALFFLYYYGYLKEYKPQLIIGLKLLCDTNDAIASEALRSYRDGETNLQILVGKNTTVRQVKYKCKLIKNKLAEFKGEIWQSVEQTLIDAKYLEYDS